MKNENETEVEHEHEMKMNMNMNMNNNKMKMKMNENENGNGITFWGIFRYAVSNTSALERRRPSQNGIAQPRQQQHQCTCNNMIMFHHDETIGLFVIMMKHKIIFNHDEKQ